VILARSPKETVAGVLAGKASIPQAAQLLVLIRVVATIAKDAGAIRALIALPAKVTCPQ
jgi:hypothetical protein